MDWGVAFVISSVMLGKWVIDLLEWKSKYISKRLGEGGRVRSNANLLRMIDYIHMNPVRRGLVERAVDWKWSSAAWYIEGREAPLHIDPIPPEWTVC